MDGTPILDIKPYLPFSESHPQARGGFASRHKDDSLEVEIPSKWLSQIPQEKQAALQKVLANDPRPAYQKNPDRIYGFLFAGMEIRFQVKDEVLTVCEVLSSSHL